jgi:hypothetical protein
LPWDRGRRGLRLGLHSGCWHAAGHGTAVHHGLAATVESAVDVPSPFVDAAFHGAQTQVDQISSAFSPGDLTTNSAHTTILNTFPLHYGWGNAFSDGAVMGHDAAVSGERNVSAIMAGGLVDTAWNKGRRCAKISHSNDVS